MITLGLSLEVDLNTIRIYIDENLDVQHVESIDKLLKSIDHVGDVKFGRDDLHELLVEYDEHFDMPIRITEALREKGYHPDIVSG